MSDQLFPVPFYEDTVVLVDHDGQPFVAMKPIVENVGLAWQVQYRKLSDKFAAVITMMVTTGADGKQYEMTCLPLRQAIHDQLDHASRMLGLTTPALETIGRDALPDHESPVLEEFWDTFYSLQKLWGGKLNHARGPGLLAINLPQLRTVAAGTHLTIPAGEELRRLLKASRAPRFVAVKAVNSAWESSTVKCWVFAEEKTSSMEIA